jgi:hypothetical protein
MWWSPARLSATQAAQLNRQLVRALAIALSEIDFRKARALPAATRADLEKVSRRWEPQRRLDPAATQTEITDSLVALLHGTREPYVPCTRTLAQARALPDTDRAALTASIARWAPAMDLRKLATRWDRNKMPLASGARTALATGLLALLQGRAEPLAG